MGMMDDVEMEELRELEGDEFDRRFMQAMIVGHGDRPSHSFVRVDADGIATDVRHYAEMFVPLDQLLTDLDLRTPG
jgi:hypothetical protein